MTNMNPIVKNEPFKYSWLDRPPVVPPNMALVLYPHDSREHCNVYLQEDTVFAEAIRKWHLDRLVHITLQAFEFHQGFRFRFVDGMNQWVDITYKFTVSVRPDRDAIKVILKNNVTDISEPILELFGQFTLDKQYKSLELLDLETDALQKIRELLSRLTYLKIQVSQVSSSVDDVSKKQIDDDKLDKLGQADIESTRRKIARDKEAAEVLRKEVEVAMEKAETERQLAEISHKSKLEEQQRIIDIKKKDIAAEKDYILQQAENTAAITEAKLQNINKFGVDVLAATDPSYKDYINRQQERIDQERENKMKDLELAKQKILLIKEMAEAGIIDDMMAGQMTQQLLLGGAQDQTHQLPSPPPAGRLESKEEVNINEDGKDVI